MSKTHKDTPVPGDKKPFYINHYGCPGSYYRETNALYEEPYTVFAKADSCIRLDKPGAQLRFGHETVLLPLVCLMGINGYDLATDNLDELEAKGWWCSSVFPMGCNLQFVFYRSNPKDQDVLFKVLLNEAEATLPIKPVTGPYYRWADFRQFCFDKLAKYKQKK